CDVPMLDGVGTWLSLHAARYFFEGHAPGPAGTHLNGRHPCYNLYRCADGVMSVGALEPKFWAALVEALGVPHLAGDAFADGEDADRVHAELEAVFLRRTRAQWVEALAGRDV